MIIVESACAGEISGRWGGRAYAEFLQRLRGCAWR